MRRFSIAALVAIFVVGVVSVPMASAGNPSGKGPPSQDCVELYKAEEGHSPVMLEVLRLAVQRGRTRRDRGHRRSALHREVAVRRGLLPPEVALTVGREPGSTLGS